VTSNVDRKIARYAAKLETMVRTARLFADLGTDPRLSVGALVVPVDMRCVRGFGYNGAAAGLDHSSVMQSATVIGAGTSGAAHAEANALIKSGNLGEPCVLVTTLMPCPYCAPLIVNARWIVAVVVCQERDDQRSGREVLEAAKIPILTSDDVSNVAEEVEVDATSQWSKRADAVRTTLLAIMQLDRAAEMDAWRTTHGA